MHTLRGVLELVVSVFKALSPEQSAKAWWIRIKTDHPEYTYYFGPFENMHVAESKLSGFTEDLQSEGAAISHTGVLWCNPPEVTVEGNHLPA